MVPLTSTVRRPSVNLVFHRSRWYWATTQDRTLVLVARGGLRPTPILPARVTLCPDPFHQSFLLGVGTEEISVHEDTTLRPFEDLGPVWVRQVRGESLVVVGRNKNLTRLLPRLSAGFGTTGVSRGGRGQEAGPPSRRPGKGLHRPSYHTAFIWSGVGGWTNPLVCGSGVDSCYREYESCHRQPIFYDTSLTEKYGTTGLWVSVSHRRRYRATENTNTVYRVSTLASRRGESTGRPVSGWVRKPSGGRSETQSPVGRTNILFLRPGSYLLGPEIGVEVGVIHWSFVSRTKPQFKGVVIFRSTHKSGEE